MKPIFHQINCREQNRPDYRQARAIIKYRPDIVIFEYPEIKGNPNSIFNKFSTDKKPLNKIRSIQNALKVSAKRYGYALSDVRTWQNISRLWSEGHNILLYNVDAPHELRNEWFEVWENTYPCALKNWLWWVRIYLRERIMANHIRSIIEEYKGKNNPKILIFLQRFHWTHVKFLLSNPTNAQIWNYYFGKFPQMNEKIIGLKIRRLNRIYYKYWKKYSHFG